MTNMPIDMVYAYTSHCRPGDDKGQLLSCLSSAVSMRTAVDHLINLTYQVTNCAIGLADAACSPYTDHNPHRKKGIVYVLHALDARVAERVKTHCERALKLLQGSNQLGRGLALLPALAAGRALVTYSERVDTDEAGGFLFV